jgi:hypothetical protein
MTCPICGDRLIETATHAHTAPWLCAECKHAFWNTELTPEALEQFRPTMRDHGHNPGIRADTTIEREQALVRSRGAS